MLIKKAPDFRYSEITPKSVYLNRRKFLAAAPAAFLAAREALSPSRKAKAKGQGGWVYPDPAERTKGLLTG